MDKNNEYIEYLKSFEDVNLNEKINQYGNNNINFNELEIIAIDKMYLSKANYFKSFKIGRILNNE